MVIMYFGTILVDIITLAAALYTMSWCQRFMKFKKITFNIFSGLSMQIQSKSTIYF